MEFLDEDARPRFVLQSKPIPQSTSDPLTQTRILTRPITIFCISLSLCFFVLSFLYLNIEPFQSILIWVGLSLLIGPFAPLSITAGDIRVGLGPPLEDPVPNDLTDSESESKKPNRRSSKSNRKIAESEPVFATISAPDPVKRSNLGKRVNGVVEKIEESEWSEGDVELLRKLMGKNPVGKPGRWDAIADGFNGRHRVESVIKKSKELGEKKMGDEDSYQKFLKDRKRIDSVNEGGDVQKTENVDVKKVGNEIVWSSGEDLALLNALKTFPKEVAMRWEKIAAAVPGKTKAACMKRVTELKKDFRSSKAANGES